MHTDIRPNEVKLEFLSMFVHSCKDKQDTKQEISWIVLHPEILRYSTHKGGHVYKDKKIRITPFVYDITSADT